VTAKLDIGLIGAPVDSGSRKRGCLMGPDAMRVAGIIEVLQQLGHSVRDYGNLTPSQLDGPPATHERVVNLQETISWTHAIRAATQQVLSLGQFPLVLGGDHSLALGTVSAIAEQAAGLDRPLYVLWLDAHTDFNTFASTQSGNVHGMPVAFFCGLPGFESILGTELKHPVPAENVLMMGIRSVDDHEKSLVREHGVTMHDMRLIDEYGVIAPLRDFLDRVRSNHGMLHVSFDVDFLDPDIAPAVATTVLGGATIREAHLIMELIFDSGLMTSLEVAELNPALDHSGKTALLMTELLASGLGRRVVDHY